MATAEPRRSKSRNEQWPLERVLFLLAGTMTALSVLLVVLVSPWFILLTAFVAVNQLTYVGLGLCPASVVLERFGFERGCRG